MMSLKPKVKLCGMTRLDDAMEACRLGVDAVGFIFYPPSPRNIGLEEACRIAHALPPMVTRVAVTVDADTGFLEKLNASGCFEAVQFHGDETPDFCRRFTGARRIKAIGLPIPPGEPSPLEFSVDAVLFDKRSLKRGGTGEPIDWDEAVRWRKKLDVPVILSGGLNVSNIEKAVEKVRPYGIDICSGAECEPGKKCHQKMKEILELCQQ